MHQSRLVRWARASMLGLLCLGFVACKTTGDNVQFEVRPIPPLPAVAQGNSNRFLLTFAVINPTDQEQPPGKYQVDIHASYLVNGKPCNRDHKIKIGPFMAKETGKFVVVDYDFAQPYGDATDPCFCSTTTECHGGLVLTLEYATGDKKGERVPGKNTKLNVAWSQDDDLTKMKVTEH